MSPIKVEVPAWEWYGDSSEVLKFPDSWNIHEQRMAGHHAKPLSSEGVSEKLQRPVGSLSLRELCRGKDKVCIIFDDMTRPTKTWQMLPAVLDELKKGGADRNKIRFVMATGAHGAKMLPDFRKKLGDEVTESFLVFNHNPFENLVELGETSNGTPVHINREVMNCDLKISVAALIPHFGYGFGGGSKILVPGVAGIETIWHNHRIREGVGPGSIEANIRRHDSEEAARMAGLDFVVNGILNSDRDVVDLVCGDVVEAHREGVKLGRKHYTTPIASEADVSIGNGYPMANEGYKAYRIAVESVKEGGDLVFLLYTPEGCRVHYYNGRFGEGYGGRGWRPDVYVNSPWKMDRVLVVTPHLMKADELYYGAGSIWVKTWDEALRLLEDTYGSEADVALYPCAAMHRRELFL